MVDSAGLCCSNVEACPLRLPSGESPRGLCTFKLKCWSGDSGLGSSCLGCSGVDRGIVSLTTTPLCASSSHFTRRRLLGAGGGRSPTPRGTPARCSWQGGRQTAAEDRPASPGHAHTAASRGRGMVGPPLTTCLSHSSTPASLLSESSSCLCSLSPGQGGGTTASPLTRPCPRWHLAAQGLREAQAQPEEGRPLGPQEAGPLCSPPEPEQWGRGAEDSEHSWPWAGMGQGNATCLASAVQS